MYDVVCVGSAVKDVFLVSSQFKLLPSKAFSTGVGECVALGTKIEVDEMVQSSGGGATNAAATFGSLKFGTGVVAKIGKDIDGTFVMNDVANHGVSKELFIKEKGETGFSVLLTEPKNGERTALVHRGVSGDLHKDDLRWNRMKTRWAYITSLGGNLTLVKQIAKQLYNSGAGVFYNPGSAEIKKGLKAFKPLLKHLVMLNLNREEAKMLFGFDVCDAFGSEKLSKLIPSKLLLVVTDGPKGAYAHLDGTTWFVVPQNTPVISRTGAGDAFGSGLAASIIRGLGIDDALRVGLLNSQGVIASYGAKRGILKKWPTKKELESITVNQLT